MSSCSVGLKVGDWITVRGYARKAQIVEVVDRGIYRSYRVEFDGWDRGFPITVDVMDAAPTSPPGC